MKILHFKVPIKLSRDNSGNVSLEMKENDKVLDKAEEIGDGTKNIVSISKELSDFNEKQKEMAKASLFPKEKESESFIIMKILG